MATPMADGSFWARDWNRAAGIGFPTPGIEPAAVRSLTHQTTVGTPSSIICKSLKVKTIQMSRDNTMVVCFYCYTASKKNELQINTHKVHNLRAEQKAPDTSVYTIWSAHTSSETGKINP